jgi:hypothetical protein
LSLSHETWKVFFFEVQLYRTVFLFFQLVLGHFCSPGSPAGNWGGGTVTTHQPGNEGITEKENNGNVVFKQKIRGIAGNYSMVLVGEGEAHKVHIYLEYHSVCPLVRIGSWDPPPPLRQASV